MSQKISKGAKCKRHNSYATIHRKRISVKGINRDSVSVLQVGGTGYTQLSTGKEHLFKVLDQILNLVRKPSEYPQSLDQRILVRLRYCKRVIVGNSLCKRVYLGQSP